MRDEGERFFALEASEPVCRWRAPVELVSDYLLNREAHELRVGFEFPVVSFPDYGGFRLGATSTPAQHAVGPLLESTRNQGWVFPGFESAFGSMDAFNARIDRMIPQGAGGCFVKVVRFERFRARELALAKTSRGLSSCRHWVEGSRGYVYVPRVSYKFALAPPKLAQDREAPRRDIDSTLRPIEDCSSAKPRLRTGDPGRAVRTRPGEAPIYFYPN